MQELLLCHLTNHNAAINAEEHSSARVHCLYDSQKKENQSQLAALLNLSQKPTTNAVSNVATSTTNMTASIYSDSEEENDTRFLFWGVRYEGMPGSPNLGVIAL